MKCPKCKEGMKKRYLQIISKKRFGLSLSAGPYYFKCYNCGYRTEITS